MESFHTRQATQFASEKDNAERLKVVRVDLKRTQDGFRTGVLHPSINKKAVDFHTPLAGSSYGYCGNFHQFNEQVLNEICSSLTLFANDDFAHDISRVIADRIQLMMAKVFVCEETGWHLMLSPDSSRARNCYRQTMMTITVVTANILDIVRFDFRIHRHPHLPYIIGDGSEYLNDLSYFFIVSHVNLKLLHQYSIPVIMNTLYLSISSIKSWLMTEQKILEKPWSDNESGKEIEVLDSFNDLEVGLWIPDCSVRTN